MDVEAHQSGEKPARSEPWVMVAEATLPGEIEALAEALSAAEIPYEEVEHTNRPVTSALIVEAPAAITNTYAIHVPLPHIERAELIIEQTVVAAIRKGVDEAFRAPWHLLFQQVPTEKMDLTFLEMRQLSAESWGDRHEVVSQRVAGWLTDGTSEIQMARYLAAAGLSEQEAHRLVSDVVRKRRDLFRATQESRRYWMHLLLWVGGVLLAIGLFLLLSGPLLNARSDSDALSLSSVTVFFILGPAALLLVGLMMGHWVTFAERPKEPKVLGKEDERDGL